MKITFLIDNISKDELIKEWGLSIYIEYMNKKILLDTGAGKSFFDNAAKLGINLNEVDAGVLSHAHFDHSDGMSAFFAGNSKAKFYLRESAAENCYAGVFPIYRYIGIRKGTLAGFRDRIEYVRGDYTLFDGVTLLPHKTEGLEKIGKKVHMYQKKSWRMVTENFSHEQSLVFDTPEGLVIFNSCSHGGADNIINEVSKTYPDKKLYAIIGGFHLYNASEKEVRGFAARVNSTGIEKVITGHCTGEKAYGILQEELGDKLTQIYTGLSIEL